MGNESKEQTERAALLSAQEMTYIGAMFDNLNDLQLIGMVEASASLWDNAANQILEHTKGGSVMDGDSTVLKLEVDSRVGMLALTAFKAMAIQALHHRLKESADLDE